MPSVTSYSPIHSTFLSSSPSPRLSPPRLSSSPVRNKHSLFSIFFVKKKAAFPRIARWVLFVLDLLMNLSVEHCWRWGRQNKHPHCANAPRFSQKRHRDRVRNDSAIALLTRAVSLSPLSPLSPLCLRSFFVYVFIIDGRLTPVQQVVVIIVLLIVIEMIIAAFLRWFCYPRSVGPIEQQVRLAICTLVLYGLFVALTAWQWTRLPENVAIIALVRFIASSIGVIFAEVAVWFLVYSFAQQCCPCIKLDDGSKSLEDIQAEEEEAERIERERERAEAIKEKRAKMSAKLKMKGVYRADEEV